MRFSRDINGLRAIAVIAVVLFHFSLEGFQGGFVGVDVFFVISGYLMTAIVMSRMQGGHLSVWRFYGDRVRRIVPALLLLCLVLLAVGWFVLLPSDYKRLGKQVAGSLSFVSNILFWREAGYFDAASHSKWLLHTWSLSVEWQFYLAYPLLLVVLRRMLGPARIRWALAAMALVSFALSVHDATRTPSAAFYLLPTRAWEMLLGGLVLLFPLRANSRMRHLLEVAGLLLIAGSVGLIDASMAWPGVRALVPTIGAALVISTRREASLLLGHRAMQALGRCSYSVYLWHWPIVVGLTQFTNLSVGPRALLGIPLSIALGWLSYRYFETPTRHVHCHAQCLLAGRAWRRLAAWPRAWLGGGVAVAIGGAVAVWATQGAPQRFTPAVRIADGEANNGNPYGRGCFATANQPAPPCVIGGSGGSPMAATMVGDSHALSVVTALVAAAPPGAGGVRFHGYAACPSPFDGATYGVSENHCGEFNRQVLSALMQEQAPRSPLVVVNFWVNHVEQARIRFATASGDETSTLPFTQERYRVAFLATLCRLAETRPVYLTEPFPQFEFDVPRTVAYRLMRDPAAADLTLQLAEHRRRNEFVLDVLKQAHQRCGVRLLDPTPYLCPQGRCLASLNRRPLYSDGHHLSEYGNRLLIPMFRQVFSDEHPR